MMRRLLAVAAAAALLLGQTASQIGLQTDGSVLLPNAWTLRPAGRQIPAGTLPLALDLSPDGRYLLALHAGAPPGISVIDTATELETARVPVEEAWLGLVFHPKGDRVFVGGGPRPVVWEFLFDRGQLRPGRRFPASAEARANDFVGDVALSPDGRFLYAANLLRNSITVMNALTGFIVREIPTGRRPYRIVFAPDGKTFYVSHWADSTVGQYNAADGKRLETIPAGGHPADLLYLPGKIEASEQGPVFAARLFVAGANTNTVMVFGISESNQARLIDQVPLAATRGTPLGTTPSALALTPDRTRLLVACSGVNAVAVVDVSEFLAQPLGLIPTGWYPAAVRAAGEKIFIANARGGRAGPRPLAGSISVVAMPTDEQLEAHTDQTLANSLYDESLLADAGGPRGHPIPSAPGQPSPLRYAVYIVTGGFSYDEVFGDVQEGNGDPARARYGAAVTPNYHRLAREFVLLDNYYASGESEIDGLHWATAAVASDFVEKLAPLAGRAKGIAFDGSEPAAYPPAGHLWTSLRALGIPYRSYGFRVENAADANQNYPGPAAAYPDSRRAAEFVREFTEMAQKGTLPRALLVRLPGAGEIADHDAALGSIVEAIRRSPVWGRTAIFVTASQGGSSDHVDPRRAPALVLSPYAKRGVADHTHYTTLSMLRTIELILGLRPLTQFDAAATPLFESFQGTARP